VIDFIEALEPLMYDPDSPINHIGTPWAFQDVTAYLQRRDDWAQFRFGVWDGTNPVTKEKDPGPDGAYALCPAFLTDEEVSEKSRVLSRTFFSAQYLCEPVPSEEALFDLALVDARRSCSTIRSPASTEPRVTSTAWSWCGSSRLVNWDFVAFPRTATSSSRYSPRRSRAARTPQPIEDVACHQFKKNLKSIWIEQVASQSLFAPWLEERKKIKGVKIRGQKIGYRLMSLQTAMRKGYLVLPKDFPGRDLLVQRLTEYPLSDSDDLISALALLSTMVERRGQLPGVPAPELGPYPTRIWTEQTSRRNDYWG
jgi:hypothetical protein